jgi:hypothetical protein
MLEIEFECKRVRRTSERCNKGGTRVDAACYSADSLALSPFCSCAVPHGAADVIARALTRHNQLFTQSLSSAEMPGPPAGSA